MPISLHAATIPSFRQIIGAALGQIDKAEAFCAGQGIAPADLLERRLIADMLPLGYQLKSIAVHSAGAIRGVRAGVFSPDRSEYDATFDAYRAVLREADAELAAVTPDEMETWLGRDMAFVAGEFRMEFVAENFLLSFSQPNFYFHATTAYDLLRAAGLPIGKRDFAGRPRIKG